MDSSIARVLLALTCSVILGVESVPYPSNGGQLGENEEEEGPLYSDALITDESFYQEFPKVVDPSAKSRFLEHVEDMTFIKKERNGTRSKRNAVLDQENLWPGGRIPFEIAPSYDAFERRIIFKAMAHWERHTCIRFYPKHSSDNYSIYINNTQPNDCSSFVGRKLFLFQRKQVISLGNDCFYFSIAVHELGHAIGLYHENNRNDRDKYITVYPESHIDPSQVQKQKFTNTLGKGYDYASIMHYGSSQGVLVSKIQAPFGGAEELSPLDIAKVNLLYNCGVCKNRPPLSIVVPPLGLPDNSTCGRLIETDQSGSFTFPDFSPNTKCAYVIAAPEGYFIEYYVQLLGSNLDSSTNCENSYIAFYNGATCKQHRMYKYSPKPKVCTSRDFRFTFLLPTNVTTISYQASPSRPQPVRVYYYINDVNECRIARQCQSCVNTAGSYNCTCSPGFYLSYPARTCYDVNECACDSGGCEHNCTNTAGSYSCSCRSGYYLQADGKSCGTRQPSATPWKVIPGSLNTMSCPVSFSVPNQPSAVTTIKPTILPPTTLPTTTKASVTTSSTLPTGEDIQVVASSTINGYDTLFSTPGWPNEPYPLSRNFEWMLQCPNGADLIDVKFEENFKVAGKMPDCPKDQVYVYSNGIKVGGPFCHTTAPEPTESLDADNTKVTFNSGNGRGSTRTGFGVRFQCRFSPTLPPPATEKPTTLPTTATTTVPPTTTMIPATARPTTLPTTARPTTARPTSQTTPLPVAVGPCGPEVITTSSRNAFGSIFSTPGWPDEPYPLNVVCEWRLQCPSASDLIDIQFEGNFKIAGKMPDCPKDQINVYSKGAKVGGPFCHTTAPEQIESLDASSARVTLDSGSGRGSTRTGFAVRFRCRATSSPTTPLPLTEKPTSHPTTAQPTTPPTTSPRTTIPEPITPPPTVRPTIPLTTTPPPTTAGLTTPSPTTVMVTTQSTPTPSATACGGVITAPNGYEYYSFSTPGWPDAPYPLHMNCEWLLQCPPVSEYVDIRFEENFKVAGKMPSCSKDKVYIESNGGNFGPFCHLTRPDPFTFLDAHSTKVIFQAGGNRGVTRTGFGVQFQCR